ncbi:hypothetical protein ACFWZU_15560 [Frateuria sp. GZRR33]|uniref:hypothetical protein n=1 Tax=Frateuria sp. GZRR33 TaxID=3351535 RepID=UPI003EDC142A
MSVIAFPKRAARTSPQHEPACVEVNATAPDCEAVRDMFNEARIRVLGNAWLIAATAGDDKAERQFWDAYVEAKAKRSPALVARIETARGLR